MNAKVEEFIKKMKKEQKAKELSQKKKHLISLGLVDESKTVKGIVYLDIGMDQRNASLIQQKRNIIRSILL